MKKMNMKKVLLLFLLLICPIVVKAEVIVTDHLIDAEIEIAGGLRVREMIVVEGTTNSFSRTLNYKMINENWDQKKINFKTSPIYNGYSLENVKVATFAAPKTIDFNAFPESINYLKVLNLKQTQDEFYNVLQNELGITYDIHKKIPAEKYVYYLEYIVSNVVVVHEDILEINYTFKNLSYDAKNTQIRVIIPYATNDETYQLWVHAPARTRLNELVDPSGEKVGFLAEIANLKTELNFRMTLPKEQVSIDLYLNHSGVNGLSAIQKVEADKQNNNNLLNIIKYIIIVIGLIYSLGSLSFLKYKNKIIFSIYFGSGLIIMLANFLFKFNFIYLYLILVLPIIMMLIKIKKVKGR